jgi:DNA-binding NtrC family response regulator
MHGNILIVDDNASLAGSLKRALESDGYTVTTAATAGEGLRAVQTGRVDVVVTDLQFSGPQGFDANAGLGLIRDLHASHPRLPVILMTAHHTTQAAIEATKLGAYEYILKPFATPALLEMIERALAGKRLMSETVEMGTPAPTGEAIIGNSVAMQKVYKEIGRVAAKPVSVLIRGETGTGKELIARAIYQHSDRANQPFILVNCAAIPETLLESELFGHEQGAFTGALTRRIGRFEQANRGTIFLDEIGDISGGTQAKLLRVLQDKTIQRLGGKETIRVDVRILAATHRDLEQAIHDRQFRHDLYYRLNDVMIFIPPLRERREDIPALVDYFLGRHGAELGHPHPSITEASRELLRQHTWPGNVRELENVIRKALLASQGFAIAAEHVRSALESTRLLPLEANQPLRVYIRGLLEAAVRGEAHGIADVLTQAVEQELYRQAFELAGGNQSKAAEWLGISRPTMREKLRAYGITNDHRP